MIKLLETNIFYNLYFISTPFSERMWLLRGTRIQKEPRNIVFGFLAGRHPDCIGVPTSSFDSRASHSLRVYLNINKYGYEKQKY